ITSKTGDLVCSTVLTGEEEELIVISQKGHIIRTKIDTIAKLSRATQGVRIMKMAENDKIASIICV
ncbi:MAG: DNA gyrase C-terminal beta-propeller domain-containing protein, partial [Candidatus Pacebacteria bacterium]|nr:DNA gyrase C-terminal beta-propeller domain-containing protein [Candidatus Paceibacterota bacterium]